MTDVTENKRLSDEELEAVAGGVSPPTIDPSALAGLMHSTVSAAVAGGGAYTVDTHTPAHTDTGTPTITGQTQTTVSGSTLFGGGSPVALDSPTSITASAPVVSGTVTLSGNLNLHIDPPPGSITEQSPGITVMHFDSSEGQFTRIIPTVEGTQGGGEPNPGGALGVAFKP